MNACICMTCVRSVNIFCSCFFQVVLDETLVVLFVLNLIILYIRIQVYIVLRNVLQIFNAWEVFARKQGP